MKFKGFTLAEVLITMTIIGVVAALTTPALFHNAGTAQVGPKLAKIKSTIENANRQLMADEEVGSLATLFADDMFDNQHINTQYPVFLSQYMRMEAVNAANHNLSSYYGDRLQGAGVWIFFGRFYANIPIFSNFMRFGTVEGARIGFETHNIAQAFSPGGNIVTQPLDPRPEAYVGVILVDINGISNPNRFGKDVFAFYLRNDGTLIPYGESIEANGAARPPRWQDQCNPANDPPVDAGTPAAGLTCTATIFENNLRVTYED